jgi:hypothetical protein
LLTFFVAEHRTVIASIAREYSVSFLGTEPPHWFRNRSSLPGVGRNRSPSFNFDFAADADADAAASDVAFRLLPLFISSAAPSSHGWPPARLLLSPSAAQL